MAGTRGRWCWGATAAGNGRRRTSVEEDGEVCDAAAADLLEAPVQRRQSQHVLRQHVGMCVRAARTPEGRQRGESATLVPRLPRPRHCWPPGRVDRAARTHTVATRLAIQRSASSRSCSGTRSAIPAAARFAAASCDDEPPHFATAPAARPRMASVALRLAALRRTALVAPAVSAVPVRPLAAAWRGLSTEAAATPSYTIEEVETAPAAAPRTRQAWYSQRAVPGHTKKLLLLSRQVRSRRPATGTGSPSAPRARPERAVEFALATPSRSRPLRALRAPVLRRSAA